MALLVERNFIVAVQAAEGVRQSAKAAALATFVAAGLTNAANATYATALAAADVAYITAVNAAANTSGLQLGTVGDTGVHAVPSVWGSIVGMN